MFVAVAAGCPFGVGLFAMMVAIVAFVVDIWSLCSIMKGCKAVLVEGMEVLSC
jgi:hypothetical protein